MENDDAEREGVYKAGEFLEYSLQSLSSFDHTADRFAILSEKNHVNGREIKSARIYGSPANG